MVVHTVPTSRSRAKSLYAFSSISIVIVVQYICWENEICWYMHQHISFCFLFLNNLFTYRPKSFFASYIPRSLQFPVLTYMFVLGPQIYNQIYIFVEVLSIKVIRQCWSQPCFLWIGPWLFTSLLFINHKSRFPPFSNQIPEQIWSGPKEIVRM